MFGSSDPRVVERYCTARGIEFTWRDGDDSELLLHKRERCQAVACHPHIVEVGVWFN